MDHCRLVLNKFYRWKRTFHEEKKVTDNALDTARKQMMVGNIILINSPV